MLIVERLRAPVFQIVLSALVSCMGTYVFTIIGTRTMANAIWLFLIPALIGILLNDGKPKQAMMACLLMAISALSSIAFMVAVWGGY
jgi:hypothetical protein